MMATRAAQTITRIVRRPRQASWDAGVLTRWVGRHIRWKIILPYALLVIALAAAGNYLATSLVQGSLDERFQNQLVQASRSGSDSLVRHEEAQIEIARSVAFTRGLPDAVTTRDRTFVRGVIQGIAANTGTELIDVLDARGQRVAGILQADAAELDYIPLGAADDPDAWPLVALALQDPDGAKYAQIVQTSAGPVLMTANPILTDGRTSGLVLAGTTLATLAAGIKADAFADVTIYDATGNPIATTFADPAALAIDTAALGSRNSGAFRDSRVIDGRRYDLIYGDLVVRGRAVGHYSVALASDFIFDANSNARWQMTVLFGVGMAVALGVGFLVAGSLTRRIQQLVATAERVAQGDLTARTPVASEDEIGKLGVCLNSMTDRLEGQYMATMRALASAVAGNDPYTIRHSRRVGELAMLLGRHLQGDERMLAQLEIGGYLHDLGHIGIRDSLLLRSDAVDEAVKPFLRSHPHIGAEPDMTKVRGPLADFIGTEAVGVQDRGSPDEPPIVARIVAAADLYDALTADRPERDALPLSSEDALGLMRTWAAGRLLHFGTVEALAQIVPDWERSQGRGSDYAALARKRRE
jgi:HAMP domain-containing protein